MIGPLPQFGGAWRRSACSRRPRFVQRRERCEIPGTDILTNVTAKRVIELEEVWGVREDTDTRAIDNFIVRLRRYIEEEPSSPRHLRTVRGVGYRFQSEPD